MMLPLLCAGLLLAACKKSEPESVETPVEDSASASDELPADAIPVASEELGAIAGTYAGVLPCADCEGIEETLTLNADGSYVRESKYQGEKAKDATPDKLEGKFSYDSATKKVTLEGVKEGSSLYEVDGDKLYFLDTDGKRVEGELASNYILTKK